MVTLSAFDSGAFHAFADFPSGPFTSKARRSGGVAGAEEGLHDARIDGIDLTVTVYVVVA